MRVVWAVYMSMYSPCAGESQTPPGHGARFPVSEAVGRVLNAMIQVQRSGHVTTRGGVA